MLELKKIIKEYVTGEFKLQALKGVDVSFRDNEFVAILGPSGCGKTTLLNIIGGLDHYTSGELLINGRSTKDYTSSDWDAYRNHSIGFIFQNYNLIPHQTILSNVELALTLSGVSKKERRERAIKALEEVGLGDQIMKKPNQMSGGQVQRVAIARALINNPDILLADEPTGALDTVTSLQIMELLKRIAQDKLVIMVTHNPDLANTYANRIVKLLDGLIIDDTNPYEISEEESKKRLDEFNKIDKKQQKKELKNRSMSFGTALLLSVNNLMTKMGRSILTAFAGSIGIIGIALILSVSEGVNAYIDTVEESTMSSYPIEIEKSSTDYASMMSAYQNLGKAEMAEEGYIETNDLMLTLIESASSSTNENNLKDFKNYIESDKSVIKDNATDVVYSYNTNLNPYYYDEASDKYQQAARGIGDVVSMATSGLYAASSMTGFDSIFNQMIGDDGFIKGQYDVVEGRLPDKANEVVILVDKNNRIADYILYGLGIYKMSDLKAYVTAMALHMANPKVYKKPALPETPKVAYDELIGYKFKYLLETDNYYIEDNQLKYRTISQISDYLKTSDTELEVVGIVKPSESAQTDTVIGGILYQSSLMKTMIEKNNNTDAMKLQLNNSEINVIYNHRFDTLYTEDDYDTILAYIDSSPNLAKKVANGKYDRSDKDSMVNFANREMLSTYEHVLDELSYVDFDEPSAIYIYPKDFNSKDAITDDIEKYNNSVSENDKIRYTDMVGLLLSSVSIIVNAISYVLIAFVSISLVVSSIMIGIITYISVLERTKEIGILRSVGASKRDISRVFNAETLSIGLTAGVFGVIISLLLIIPINLILHHFTGISYLSAKLPFFAGIILVAISMLLTFIAGLIPSRIAAKKDPVEALRTE